jgi:hypothetical protein
VHASDGRRVGCSLAGGEERKSIDYQDVWFVTVFHARSRGAWL